MQTTSKSNNPKLVTPRNGEGGFSMLELVVSMLIFLVVTGSIFGLLQVARQSRTTVSLQVQLDKSVRLGLNVLGRDTYNAGFDYPLGNTVVLPDNRISTRLGIPVDFDPARDTVPPIIVGNNNRPNTFNLTPGVVTDQVTFLFKDSTFNLIGVAPDQISQPLNIPAAATVGGIDEIAPLSGSNSSCRVNDIYLISGSTGSTLGVATSLSGGNKVHFANLDPLNFNQTGGAGPLSAITTPASMQRVQMVTYFVTPDGILTRREFANVPPPATPAGFVDEPLIYGVENFQIQYVMDDGTLSDNPSAGPDGIPGTPDDVQANLAAIRQVRYTVSVRSIELDQNSRPYRVNMTSTFSTRNLGYK